MCVYVHHWEAQHVVTMLLGLLYTLYLLPLILAHGDLPPGHEVNAKEGSTITLPCEASRGIEEDFFYRSWSRGKLTRIQKNVTKLFFQIPGSSPDRAPGARADMEVDDSVFNLTITNVENEDMSPFTCYVYKNQKYIYSYAYVSVKSTYNAPLSTNQTGLIVGLSSGVVLLALLVAAIILYRKKTSGALGMTRLSGQESTEELTRLDDAGRSDIGHNIKVKVTEKHTQHKMGRKYGKKKKAVDKNKDRKNKSE